MTNKDDRNMIEAAVERALVDSELLKACDAILEQRSRFSWSDFLSHPMLLTVFGFLVTAILGSALENRLSENQRWQQDVSRIVETARAEETQARETLVGLVSSLHNRTARGAMLRSAIARGDNDETLARKQLYDEAYFDWNVGLNSGLISLRQHIFDADGNPTMAQSGYEDILYVDVRNALRAADSCLATAFDVFRADGAVPQDFLCDDAPWQDVVRTNTRLATQCMDAIMQDALRYFHSRAETRIAIVRNRTPDSDITFETPDNDAVIQACRS